MESLFCENILNNFRDFLVVTQPISSFVFQASRPLYENKTRNEWNMKYATVWFLTICRLRITAGYFNRIPVPGTCKAWNLAATTIPTNTVISREQNGGHSGLQRLLSLPLGAIRSVRAHASWFRVIGEKSLKHVVFVSWAFFVGKIIRNELMQIFSTFNKWCRPSGHYVQRNYFLHVKATVSSNVAPLQCGRHLQNYLTDLSNVSTI